MHKFLQETVQHCMSTPVRAVAPETTLGDLLRMFTAHNIDVCPVESDGRLLGIVAKADILKAFATHQDFMLSCNDVLGTTVDEIMSRNVTMVDSAMKLSSVLRLMNDSHFKCFPVTGTGGRVIGIITRNDLIGALAECNKRQDTPEAYLFGAQPICSFAIA